MNTTFRNRRPFLLPGTVLLKVLLFTVPAQVRGVDSLTVQDYKEKAEKGSAAHQFNLGLLYDEGRGVEQNSTEAVKWFQKAALQGERNAERELADHYYAGRGVAQNYVAAVRWYWKAAAEGDVMAKYRLGWCYEHGQGVGQSHADAVKWYNLYNRAMGRPELTESETPAGTPIPAAPQSAPTQSALSTKVEMVKENGIFKVPVQLNGAISLKFIIDSGASEVQIPKDVFLTLVRTETIGDSDFLPGTTVILADGSKVKSDRFILRSIKVGETTFTDVHATVGGLNAPLLLGQSFLSRFTEWKIDNKNGTLVLIK
jgi:predicted aspartyl protease